MLFVNSATAARRAAVPKRARLCPEKNGMSVGCPAWVCRGFVGLGVVVAKHSCAHAPVT